MDVTRRHRVKPGGGFVEEKHHGVVEQRPGQGHPLTQSLGQRTAQVAGPVGQVDCL